VLALITVAIEEVGPSDHPLNKGHTCESGMRIDRQATMQKGASTDETFLYYDSPY